MHPASKRASSRTSSTVLPLGSDAFVVLPLYPTPT